MKRRALALIHTELKHLTTVRQSDRRWQMPFCAALASGLPLLIGSYFGHLEYGFASSLGGMVFLYTPNTKLSHRAVFLMACAFSMSACYALGVICHFVPALLVPILAGTTIVVSMLCRFYRVGPPGSLFFVMAASIGAYSPIGVLQVPMQVGLVAMGCILACVIAFFYSLYLLRLQAPQPVAPLPPATFDFVVFDPIIIGVFVGLSLAVAQGFHLQRAYWVPVSCLAVIQEMSLRAVWNKQFQRIAGTGIGLMLAWTLLTLPLDNWSVSAIMMVLSFLIETLVVRHYGLAVIFITPLTIFLAEGVRLGQGSAGVMQARLLDTVLGCLLGFIGGICLHSPRFREVAGKQIRRMVPARLMP